jgi:hypothetical protein
VESSPPPPATTESTTTRRRYLAFAPSPDHDRTVDGYRLEIVTATSDRRTVLHLDLGKPAVIGNECRVDIEAVLLQLPGGVYEAVVRATNAHGSSAGAVSSPFER